MGRHRLLRAAERQVRSSPICYGVRTRLPLHSREAWRADDSEVWTLLRLAASDRAPSTHDRGSPETVACNRKTDALVQSASHRAGVEDTGIDGARGWSGSLGWS